MINQTGNEANEKKETVQEEKQTADQLTQTILNVIKECKEHNDYTNAKKYKPSSTGCFFEDEVFERLKRSAREFSAQMYFIVVFGPLKAGKSTLINILAGEDVSPTGFGFETTLRPSIILKGGDRFKESITQYMYSGINSDGNEKQKMFDNVADYLRCIGDLNKNEITQHSYEFNQINLENLLTKRLNSSEPLITTVACNKYTLPEEVAIIDMPGLDGVKTNAETDPLYQWVLRRADFFIFVQSSMSGVNQSTKNFFKTILGSGKKKRLLVVYNNIDAKFWLTHKAKEIHNERIKSRLEEDTQLLLDDIHWTLDKYHVNLGAQWDNINLEQQNFNQSKEEIESYSNYSDYFNKFKKNIEERRKNWQRTSATVKMEETLEQISEVLNKQESELNNTIQNYRKIKDDFEKQIKTYEEEGFLANEENCNKIAKQFYKDVIDNIRKELLVKDETSAKYETYKSYATEYEDDAKIKKNLINDKCNQLAKIIRKDFYKVLDPKNIALRFNYYIGEIDDDSEFDRNVEKIPFESDFNAIRHVYQEKRKSKDFQINELLNDKLPNIDKIIWENNQNTHEVEFGFNNIHKLSIEFDTKIKKYEDKKYADIWPFRPTGKDLKDKYKNVVLKEFKDEIENYIENIKSELENEKIPANLKARKSKIIDKIKEKFKNAMSSKDSDYNTAQASQTIIHIIKKGIGDISQKLIEYKRGE